MECIGIEILRLCVTFDSFSSKTYNHWTEKQLHVLNLIWSNMKVTLNNIKMCH